ncbi:hypothetical protein J2X06_002585 [Lysobacter niastensis]|uniref:Uncharacterized protein n=1 Tax=Lysobacter niastensis TaxID=380629 RepID=A0ABU1WD25_9GAMM|nr:hypothetical protein [Lysobacter niastensis]MDR7135376.1 hypothetical protein [Lysobacter niastensis]
MLDSVVTLLGEMSVLAKGVNPRTSITRLYSAFSSVHACQVDIFEMIERAIVDGEPLVDIVQLLLHRHAEENSERIAVLDAVQSILDRGDLGHLHAFFSALRAYFEQLPLSGDGAAARALADAIASSAREPRSLRSRGQLAHAAAVSLLAVKRGASQVDGARASIGAATG